MSVQDVFPPTWSRCPSTITVPVASTSNNITVYWVEPTPSDNGAVVSNSSNYVPGDVFGISLPSSNGTLVEYTAVDDAGLVGTCRFNVVVQDTTNPTIQCRASGQDVSMDAGRANFTATDAYAAPVVLYDNDGTPALNVLSTTVFPAGLHSITRIARDPSGNTANCTFAFTVVDREKPVFLDCAGAVKVQVIIVTKNSANEANITWQVPRFEDNVHVSSVQYLDVTDGVGSATNLTNNNMTVVFSGVTTQRQLQVVVVDSSGNENTCSLSLNIATTDASRSTGDSSSSDSFLSTPVIIGIVIGAVALALLFLLTAIYQRRKRQRGKPHDFSDILTMMQNLPRMADGPVAPREIRREHVKIISNLGKGNFGSVDKATLQEQSAAGLPAYLVAVKQLLSKRNEDKVSLLEEAAIMAQFQHVHCVCLIGVVTVGDPLMVSSFFDGQ